MFGLADVAAIMFGGHGGHSFKVTAHDSYRFRDVSSMADGSTVADWDMLRSWAIAAMEREAGRRDFRC